MIETTVTAPRYTVLKCLLHYIYTWMVFIWCTRHRCNQIISDESGTFKMTKFMTMKLFEISLDSKRA